MYTGTDVMRQQLRHQEATSHRVTRSATMRSSLPSTYHKSHNMERPKIPKFESQGELNAFEMAKIEWKSGRIVRNIRSGAHLNNLKLAGLTKLQSS
jgi:hypothetical protein